ncbi:UNVERIFIED_CONTAM: hypothetical protein RMT77_015787 [Armadillidium vulgare]
MDCSNVKSNIKIKEEYVEENEKLPLVDDTQAESSSLLSKAIKIEVNEQSSENDSDAIFSQVGLLESAPQNIEESHVVKDKFEERKYKLQKFFENFSTRVDGERKINSNSKRKNNSNAKRTNNSNTKRTNSSDDNSKGQVESSIGELVPVDAIALSKMQSMQSPTKNYDDIKRLRQSGQSYINRKGKCVPSAKFFFKICKCHMNCKDKLSEAKRREIFENFWRLGSWDFQSNFIAQSVREQPCKRRYSKNSTKRKVTRVYKLYGVKVCQSVFTSTLGINHMRVDYCLKRKTNFLFCSPDKRGKNNPKKNSDETINYIWEFLDRFPKYHSNYSVDKRQYVNPTLSKKKMHGLYVQEMKAQNKKYVSYPTFNNVFKEYNVGIYAPKKDTCQLCDRLSMQIQNNPSENLKGQLNSHQMRAQYARERFQQSTVVAKQCPDILSFSFNLEKTLSLPYINSPVMYYKRPLWLYNFVIKTLHDNQCYTCVWVENEGKCGSREICSCILEFLNSQDMSRVRKLSSFSDSCGGQNKNENIIAFMMYVCQMYNVDWEHTYLESGHSNLHYDSDFVVIEKCKQKVNSIFSVNEWTELIETAKPKNSFKIIRMNGKMINFDELTSEFTFRTTNTDHDPFSWLEMKYLEINVNSKIMKYKTTNDPRASVFKIDFSKPDEKPLHSITLKPSYLKGVPISKVKYDDLQSVLQYVPPCHHKFYQDLPHEVQPENGSTVHPDIRDHDDYSNYS